MGVTVNPELLEDEQESEILPVGVYLMSEEIPADRVKLFEVNDRQFTAPRNIDKRVIFRYLRSLHQDDSDDKAMAGMMYGVLGEAVMDTLAEQELSDEEFDQVMKVVRKHTMGAAERSLGNSSNGRRR